MPLNRTSPEGEKKSDIEVTLLEAGDHDGRLVMVADLGLQRKEYKGECAGYFRQLALGIEVVGETITIDGKVQPRLMWTKPFYIYSTLTEKGNELKLFKVFDSSATEGQVPDWDAQLGKPCNVVVTHTQGKGTNSDNTYDNISDLGSIPAKYQDNVPDHLLKKDIGMNQNIESNLFGLAKYVFDKRVESANSTGMGDDDIPF